MSDVKAMLVACHFSRHALAHNLFDCVDRTQDKGERRLLQRVSHLEMQLRTREDNGTAMI
jgi:hypothetical protein